MFNVIELSILNLQLNIIYYGSTKFLRFTSYYLCFVELPDPSPIVSTLCINLLQQFLSIGYTPMVRFSFHWRNDRISIQQLHCVHCFFPLTYYNIWEKSLRKIKISIFHINILGVNKITLPYVIESGSYWSECDKSAKVFEAILNTARRSSESPYEYAHALRTAL